MAAAQPGATYPASLRVSSARRRPAARCSSCMSTNEPAASRIASSTSGGMSEPPIAVKVVAALMSGRTPSRS
ncbi:hypothetical protein [Pseudolysinimonas kribbensis]|uniref:hypothetical protein n=1 Tax=Pseudolysinimonas kribbensis TaxID=433641 RepID=UPI0024E0776C|nr:hypothetical protein [Pseudolysinimonas kribbensis]